MQPLIRALDPHIYLLHWEKFERATFELSHLPPDAGPEQLVLQFVSVITELPEAARELWDRATRRVFDIGFNSRTAPYQESHQLAPGTLRAVADIGTEIAITVYDLPAGEVVAERSNKGLR